MTYKNKNLLSIKQRWKYKPTKRQTFKQARKLENRFKMYAKKS